MTRANTIADEKYLVFDGGLGTQLVANGYFIDEDPLWSARPLVDKEDALLQVHKQFMVAGADIISSGTYQASISGFMKHLNCSVSDAYHYMRKGASILKEARDEFWNDYLKSKEGDDFSTLDRIQPYIAASLGPYGVLLHDGSEYTGSYIDQVDERELIEWHRSRIQSLENEDLDLFMFDTIPVLREADIIVSLLREFPNIRAAISFSAKDSKHISHGESLEDAIAVTSKSPQVVAVGINCTEPTLIETLLKIFPRDFNRKILVMPNAGDVWKDKKWTGDRSLDIARDVPKWMSLNAKWIGGCCRTTLDDISCIRKILLQ